jgi:hypothetical protein
MYFPATSAGAKPPNGFMGEPGFPDLLTYVRRLSYLMAMGRPDATVALFLPSSSLWLGNDASDAAFVSTERLLSEHQIDFDVVDEDALARDLKALPGSFETLSGNRYRTVILPAPMVISAEIQARLREFAKGGGKVVFLGGAPKLISARTMLYATPATAGDFLWATVVDAQLPPTPTPPMTPPAAPPAPQVVPSEILAAVNSAAVAPVIRLDSADTALRVMKRRWKNADVYLLFNEGSQASDHVVTLMSKERIAETWNPQTGVVAPLQSKQAGGNPTIRLKLQSYETQVIVVR